MLVVYVLKKWKKEKRSFSFSIVYLSMKITDQQKIKSTKSQTTQTIHMMFQNPSCASLKQQISNSIEIVTYNIFSNVSKACQNSMHLWIQIE